MNDTNSAGVWVVYSDDYDPAIAFFPTEEEALKCHDELHDQLRSAGYDPWRGGVDRFKVDFVAFGEWWSA